MAYIKYINPNTKDSHQTSPAYMLTFLRWANRDTANFSDAQFLELRKPMLVINDCVNLTVSSSKSNHIHTANMTMLAGDINYSTAVAPGDFVLINMLDSDEKLFGIGGTPNSPAEDSLYARATNLKPINRAHDGFKGLFRIQSVKRNIQTNPNNGQKIYYFQIQAAAFTEFNQVIYFNTNLRDGAENNGDLAAINFGASEEWGEVLLQKQNTVDVLFKKLVGFLIGEGFNANYVQQKSDVVRNFNKNFLIPPAIGALMNIRAPVLKAADLFNFYIGIEKYAGSKGVSEATGLNPTGTKRAGHYLQSTPLTGAVLLQGEPFGQVTAWSILQQYSNSLINEMYTAYKLTPENEIMPCLVFRQKPFTSSNFSKQNPDIPATEFLSLPRWKVSTKLIESLSLGRDDQARINFVHIIGKTRYLDIKQQTVQQESLNAWKIDKDDVLRSGLKPIITSCDFDFPADGVNKDNFYSVRWNALYADWVFNGHLKENGNISCVGLEDPIAVGDNLEIENTVYHIESINHIMTMEVGSGKKSFKTNMSLSFGVDNRTTGTYNPIYPEMQFTDSESNRKAKNKSGIYPGFSDTQDIAGRVQGEEITKTKEKAFSVSPKKIFNKDDDS